MSVYGIGCDIVKIARIKKALKNKNFIKKIFTLREIKIIKKKNNKISSYAKKFAAKEAFSKAIGSGMTKGISFKEISIENDKKGKPYIDLLGTTKKIVKNTLKKKYKIFLTISDEQSYAMAVVLITY